RFLPHQQSKFTRSRNTFYLIRVPKGLAVFYGLHISLGLITIVAS
ncbi:MAG: hypothetical protein ACI819_002156, partial [Neolewinella sp.]